MTKRYLIDTSIWIDLREDRKGYNGEPLGEYAIKFLLKVRLEKSRIIVTDHLYEELGSLYNLSEIRSIFPIFQDILVKVIVSENQKQEAEIEAKERNVPKGDVLFAIVARDNELILVTRDNHFKKLKDISKYYKPEQLI